VVHKFSPDEIVITDVLRDGNCYNTETSMSPDDLKAQCKKLGLLDPERVDAVLINLFDNDVVEYDMDEACNVTNLWLI